MSERCPHCGADLPPTDDAFCPQCREPLEEGRELARELPRVVPSSNELDEQPEVEQQPTQPDGAGMSTDFDLQSVDSHDPEQFDFGDPPQDRESFARRYQPGLRRMDAQLIALIPAALTAVAWIFLAVFALSFLTDTGQFSAGGKRLAKLVQVSGFVVGGISWKIAAGLIYEKGGKGR